MFGLRHGPPNLASEVHELPSLGAELVTSDSSGVGSRAGSFHSNEGRLANRKMNGLRIYVIAHGNGTGRDPAEFYCRRDNGPFYRWTLDDSSWSVARVISSSFSSKSLTTTSWKVVPAALQKSIIEHYQD
jgi:hypothetical protein